VAKPTPAEFRALAEQLRLPGYDYLVVADGSGTLWNRPCGYWADLFDPATDAVEELGGALTHGTNNRAELLPFLLAFWRVEALARAAGKTLVRVACVSDSKLTVDGASGVNANAANPDLWAFLEYFDTPGSPQGLDLRFEWRWVPRNSNPVHERADDMGRRLRHAVEGVLQ
jgi:ribonuclease HI